MSPTIARAALVTSSQLGTYDSVKNNVLKNRFGMEEGYPVHCASAFIAGIAITLASNPADVVKSRYLADSGGEECDGTGVSLSVLRKFGGNGLSTKDQLQHTPALPLILFLAFWL